MVADLNLWGLAGDLYCFSQHSQYAYSFCTCHRKDLEGGYEEPAKCNIDGLKYTLFFFFHCEVNATGTVQTSFLKDSRVTRCIFMALHKIYN